MNDRPSAFQERLGEQLALLAADRLTPAATAAAAPNDVRATRARRPRVLLAAGALAVLTAGLVAYPVLGHDTSPGSAAYAVSKGADGEILVKLFNRDGIPSLQRDLASRGIRFVVLQESSPSSCPRADGVMVPDPVLTYLAEHGTADGGAVPPEILSKSLVTSSDGSFAVRLTPQTMPPGTTLVLEVPPGHSRSGPFGMAVYWTVPTCVPDYSQRAPELPNPLPTGGPAMLPSR
ncbi:hypothetical protein P3T37_006098 [Kitasatospora sp. MAA4]|uniref:hypothetical protein n=1 Tax=Kitasatospora sp. MAA4 TaxID=3035093 RepID=UPI0024751A44|nr:hypothetical protein [Kitasatospora sp. MAA4]MDH6136667.1 hypothetical protein [Kitasatospora sp. MAA4]